jgi:uncharacterized protein YceH (UPF0502 family)
MAERVNKGQAIIDRINWLSWMKKRVESGRIVSIFARTEGEHGSDYRFADRADRESSDPWKAKAQRRMIAVLVEEIDAEIARLEAELAEL